MSAFRPRYWVNLTSRGTGSAPELPLDNLFTFFYDRLKRKAEEKRKERPPGSVGK
jgi:hypothetical protein